MRLLYFLVATLFVCLITSVSVLAQVVNIDASPASLTFEGDVGDNLELILTISNSGNSTLDYQIFIENPVVSIASSVMFVKDDFADATLEENQDRINADVFITRGNNSGLFNAANESSFNGNGPSGTEWSLFPTVQSVPDDYGRWRDNAGPRVSNFFDFENVYSLRLIDEDRFFDVQFLSWTQNNNGGGFSYLRQEIVGEVLGANINEGSVGAQSSEEVIIVADLSLFRAGTFESTIVINSNATDNSTIEIPVTLNIGGGVPDLVLNEDDIELPSTVISATSTSEFIISNMGSGFLEIDNVVSDNQVFSASPTTFNIPPFGSALVTLSGTPTAVGTAMGNLTISSNVPDVILPVSVIGQNAPELDLPSTSLTFSFDAGTSNQEVLIIENTGDGTLEFSLEVESTSQDVVTFERPSLLNVEPITLENTDVISDDVWITRSHVNNRNGAALINAAVQSTLGTENNSGPEGTEWAFGKTTEQGVFDYDDWSDVASPSSVGRDLFFEFTSFYSMRLTNENRYFDIQFLSWNMGASEGGQGGGAFSYTRQEFPGWLTLDESDGFSSSSSIESGEQLMVSLDFAELRAGTYEASLILRSNDLDESEITIPIQITVSGGEPEINEDFQLEIGFDDIIVGSSQTLSLEFDNEGFVPVSISGISSDNPAFVPVATSLSVAPSLNPTLLDIVFTPDAVNSFSGELTLSTDDPDLPSVSINLNGEGVGNPVISIANTELIDQGVYPTDSTSTFIINVANTGESELTGNIRVELPGAEPVVFTKLPGADPFIAENQDRIADDIYITRGAQEGLFNAALENGYNNGPLGTEWAFGRSGAVSLNDDYGDWSGNACPSCEDTEDFFLYEFDYSLHLTGLARFYDLRYLAWSSGGNGGGFSYTRTEVPGWISVNPDFSISAGTDQDINFQFETTDFIAGTYPARIVFESNDPVTPEISIEATITVEGEPEVEISGTLLQFGDIFTNNTSTLSIEIENVGSDVLTISSTSGNSFLTVSPVEASISPTQSQQLLFSLTPTSEGMINETVTITTNDVNNPTFEININANSLDAPQIEVNPALIEVELFSGETEDIAINISNTGGSDLDWEFVDLSFPDLEDILTRFVSAQPVLSDLTPGTVQFMNEGNDEFFGGPFEDGNEFGTNGNGSINYTDGEISSSTSIDYFTLISNGVFISSGNLSGASSFGVSTSSELNSESGREVSGFEDDISFLGSGFRIFYRRVFGGTLPSVNQIIILEDNGNLERDLNLSPLTDENLITGLNGDDLRYYYLMFISEDGLFVTDNELREISNEIASIALNTGGLNLLSSNTPDMGVEQDVTSGTIEEEGDADVSTISINADEVGSGSFSFDLFISSNDPDNNLVRIPVDLRVGNIINNEDIDDIVVNEGFSSTTVDLDGVFVDSDGDELTFITASSRDDLVTIATQGNTATITEVSGTGSSTLSIAAADGNGNEAFANFQFRVNDIPDIVNELSDVTVDAGFQNQTINISDVFADSDEEDTLMLSVSSASEDVVTVTINEDSLLISEVGEGSSVITLSVDDGSGGTNMNTFTFTVEAIILSNIDVFQDDLTIYPNPSSQILNIQQQYLSKDAEWRIFNIEGKSMMSGPLSENTQINVSVLPAGIYNFVIEDNKVRTSKRISVVK
ncbi:MAG: choice-of-anchor D domain-containing protein [Bacteroidota bacterium]